MKKVNLLIGTLSDGGAERVVSNLSLNLSDKFKKNILLFGSYDITYPYCGNLEIIDGNYYTPGMNKNVLFFKRIKSLKRLKSEDICISFLEYPNLLNCLTSNRNGKTIVSVRNHMSTKHGRGIKSKIWNTSIKYFYPKADLVIACSEEIKSDLVDNYSIKPEKIKVIYNSYDIDKIEELCQEPIEQELKYIFEKPVVISSGRLNTQKGFEHLIRVFSLARKKFRIKIGDTGKRK